MTAQSVTIEFEGPLTPAMCDLLGILQPAANDAVARAKVG